MHPGNSSGLGTKFLDMASCRFHTETHAPSSWAEAREITHVFIAARMTYDQYHRVLMQKDPSVICL